MWVFFISNWCKSKNGISTWMIFNHILLSNESNFTSNYNGGIEFKSFIGQFHTKVNYICECIT
jgi:hypothetical protein